VVMRPCESKLIKDPLAVLGHTRHTIVSHREETLPPM
jgi:hypothetical protein